MEGKFKEILEEAGWYEGRLIEIDYLIEMIRQNQFTIPNRIVENFLKEYGNLEFNFKIINGQSGNIRLIIEEIAPYIETRTLKILQSLANENLVPIGTMFNDDAHLFISYSGKFYMTHKSTFFLIGYHFLDFLDNLINQRHIHKIG